MLKKTSCKIVHISSISAISLRGSAPYAASKTFLNSYLTTLARELGETNIVVSGIMPGALFAKGGHWDRVKNKSYENERFLRHHHAIGRLWSSRRNSSLGTFSMFQIRNQFFKWALINIDGGTM